MTENHPVTTPHPLPPGVHFYEVQHFSRLWIWLLIIIAFLAPAFVIPTLEDPQAATDPHVFWPLTIMLGGLMLSAILLALVRLVTEVRDDGLHVTLFLPFIRRHIAFQQIASCQARTYRPILEYGGWGARWTLTRGKAWNARGNRGVQLVMTSGKRLLIGSQRPEEFATAINSRLPSRLP